MGAVRKFLFRKFTTLARLIGKSSSLELPIYNNGDSSLILYGAVLEGDSDFSLQNFVADMTIAPDEFKKLIIVFSPTSIGQKTAPLIIESNDNNNTYYIQALNGTGKSKAKSKSSSCCCLCYWPCICQPYYNNYGWNDWSPRGGI